jgi:hypothetical protein
VQQAALALARGAPAVADLDALRELADRYAAMPAWRALVARLEFERGDDDAARASLALCLRGEGADPDAICTATLAADVAAGLGDRAACERLYAALAPYEDRNAVFDKGWAAFGAVARALAVLSEGDRASAHLRRAHELHAAWGAPLLSGRAARTGPSSADGSDRFGPSRPD